MKTLKTTFALLVMLFANSAFSQTKEETIEWLNTNGKLLLTSDGPFRERSGTRNDWFEKVDGDYIIMFDGTEFDGKSHMSRYEIPLKSILYQELNSINKSESTYDSRIGFFYLMLQSDTKLHYKDKNGEIQTWETSKFPIGYKKENEENAKRVLKAIMHLAKLSGAKENKQTF